MKHIIQVLKFEYLGCVKSKSFIISTVIFMLLIVLMAFLPGIIMSATSSENAEMPDGEKPVIAVCDKAYNGSKTVKDMFEKNYPFNSIELTDESAEIIKDKINSGDYIFAVMINEPLSVTYFTKNNSLLSVESQMVQSCIKEIYQSLSFEKLGIAPDVSMKIINAETKINTVTTGTDQTKNYLSTYILMMMLYMAIIMYGSMVSQSVVSEKNSRAMEMLITCAKPSHLMFGKVIGSGLAGLTQMVLILSTALVSLKAVPLDKLPKEIRDMLAFPVDTVLYALLFFLLAFFIYSFLLGAFASLASRSEDLNTVITPVMLMLIAAFMVVIIPMNAGTLDGTVMQVCSYIPFTAPLAMFIRVAMSDVTAIEIIISIVVQLASIYIFGMLAAAIYRVGVLLYGNAPKPAEIVKLLKEQHITNKKIKAELKNNRS